MVRKVLLKKGQKRPKNGQNRHFEMPKNGHFSMFFLRVQFHEIDPYDVRKWAIFGPFLAHFSKTPKNTILDLPRAREGHRIGNFRGRKMSWGSKTGKKPIRWPSRARARVRSIIMLSKSGANPKSTVLCTKMGVKNRHISDVVRVKSAIPGLQIWTPKMTYFRPFFRVFSGVSQNPRIGRYRIRRLTSQFNAKIALFRVYLMHLEI